MSTKSKSTQLTKLDLANYRTPELLEQLTSLLNIPQAVRQVLVTSLVLAGVSWIACTLLVIYAELSGLSWLMVSVYGLAAGCVLGVGLGLIRVVAFGLSNLESVLHLLLHVSQRVASDYEAVQAGESRLPTSTELVSQVYENIFIPLIEKSAKKSFGLLARPLMWIERRSIGWAVRYLERRVEKIQSETLDTPAVERELSTSLETAAGFSERIQNYCDVAGSIVRRASWVVRLVVLTPMVVLYLIAVAVAAVPVVVLCSYVLS